MASVKKKPAAKRPVKYAAKTQSAATHAAVKAASDATSYWTQKGSQNWQKNAQDWMSQGTKMLQFPQSGDMGEAGKQAAATMQSATENAMKMGSDFMGQLFGKTAAMPDLKSFLPQMPHFDANSAQEKLTSFTRESAEQLQKSASAANRAATETAALSRESAETLVEVTNVAVSVSKEVTAELIAYLNKQFSQNVELSKQVLTCRTLNDMFDLSSRIMKTNLDGFFSESVKLSELLFRSANEISEPLNERVSETTERLSKVLTA